LRLAAILALMSLAGCAAGTRSDSARTSDASMGTPTATATIAITEIDSEIHPNAFAFDPKTRRLLVTVACTADVCDSSRDALWVIDAATNKVVKRVPIPGIGDAATHGPSGRVFVTASGGVWVLDGNSYAVLKKVSLENARSIVADPAGGQIFVSADGDPSSLGILDIDSNRLTKTIPAFGTPMAVDEQRGVLYAVKGTTLVTADAKDLSIVRNVSLGWSAGDIDVDGKTGHVYVGGGFVDQPATGIGDFVEDPRELKIFFPDGTERSTIGLEGAPVDVAVDSTTSWVFVVSMDHGGSGVLETVDPAKAKVLHRVKDVPRLAMEFDPTHRTLYLLDFTGVTVYRLS
jgi:DNA-binding beta-propeller fold protein YncE